MDTYAVTATVYESNPLHTTASTNIRLIELLFDESSYTSATTPISCKLHVVSLDESPSYICLSYVWGDPAATETILVDGQLFTVRVNLFNFLCQMKQEGNSGLFWIDAICIDQASILERNHQVGMMGKIYSNATKVIAWFGAGPETLSRAMEELEALFPIEPEEPRDWRPLVDHLDQVCKCDYWSRIWIIQEYVLSKEVELQCGAHKIKGDFFIQLLDLAKSYHGQMAVSPAVYNDNDDFQSITHAWWQTHAERVARYRLRHYGSKAPSPLGDWGHFQGLFNTFRTMGCADVRDRVYALLSLVEPTELYRFPIHPDYAKSTTKLFVELIERRRNEIDGALFNEDIPKTLQHSALHLQRGLELDDNDPTLKHTLAALNQEYLSKGGKIIL